MTIVCVAPGETAGTVLRLSRYLDCQARALGENGFAAFAGGSVVTPLLTGAMTIFVALIGYRFLLGRSPSLADGVGWIVRLGLVLTLATSWPAFQTLVYRVATDGPGELAAVLLPAVGLPAADYSARVQRAYDIVRQDTAPTEAASTGPVAPSARDPSRDQSAALTASLLVLSGMGVTAALRLTAGILIAIGPLVIVALLFDGALGLLNGWLRALAGAAFGVFVTSITGALEIVAVEREIARINDARLGLVPASALDPQALMTTVGIFAVIVGIAAYAAFRVAGAIRLPSSAGFPVPIVGRVGTARTIIERAGDRDRVAGGSAGRADGPVRTRASAVSDALVVAARRDARRSGAGSVRDRRRDTGTDAGAHAPEPSAVSGPGGRRASGRRTASARRRDKSN